MGHGSQPTIRRTGHKAASYMRRSPRDPCTHEIVGYPATNRMTRDSFTGLAMAPNRSDGFELVRA